MKKTSKLDAMMGKFYQHKTENKTYNFLSYKQKKDVITIATDSEWLETTQYDLNVFIDEFIEVHPNPMGKDFLPANQQQDKLPVHINSKTLPFDTMQILKQKLMSSIEKVDEDPKYIPQAHAISKSVGTLISLAKMELELKTKL